MMTASAEVIAVRTQRLAVAPLPLPDKDAREVRRMVQEKAEAAVESVRAVAMPLATQTFGLLPDMLRVAASPDLSTLAARQARLGRKLQQKAVGLSHAAMTPFFKRARANAQRLRRTPK
ncbi:MAG TPA: hypothetical protein VG839_10065 [Asticcacaulis sp.]|nr:hypothetical protein [Asticcacaulis sp.]